MTEIYIIIYNFIFYWVTLDYNCSYTLRPNFRAIFRMIFEQVEFSIDNACNLRDLVLKKLVKITVAMYKVVQI